MDLSSVFDVIFIRNKINSWQLWLWTNQYQKLSFPSASRAGSQAWSRTRRTSHTMCLTRLVTLTRRKTSPIHSLLPLDRTRSASMSTIVVPKQLHYPPQIATRRSQEPSVPMFHAQMAFLWASVVARSRNCTSISYRMPLPRISRLHRQPHTKRRKLSAKQELTSPWGNAWIGMVAVLTSSTIITGIWSESCPVLDTTFTLRRLEREWCPLPLSPLANHLFQSKIGSAPLWSQRRIHRQVSTVPRLTSSCMSSQTIQRCKWQSSDWTLQASWTHDGTRRQQRQLQVLDPTDVSPSSPEMSSEQFS